MKTVNINVQKVDNGYVVACDFDRYDSRRKVITVETTRAGIDSRLSGILDDLDSAEEDD